MENEAFSSLAQNQPLVYQQLQKSFEHGRLAHAYLFEGEKGTGKHEIGLWLAQHLFCTQMKENQPCGICNNCRRIQQNEHPDVVVVLPEGQTIKVDQIRYLQSEFSRSGYESKKKVFLIKDAEKMNIAAANSLLKFLEEPQGQFLAILETDALGRILPTIQSRCQVLHFQELSKPALVKRLQKEEISLEKAQLLAFLTNSFGKAVEISQDEWFNEAKDTIRQWFSYLIESDPQAFIYVQKKMTKVFKEKEQQFSALSMLLFYFQEAQRKAVSQNERARIKSTNQTIERILSAEQKLRSNVSFQSVAEQLALQVVFSL